MAERRSLRERVREKLNSGSLRSRHTFARLTLAASLLMAGSMGTSLNLVHASITPREGGTPTRSIATARIPATRIATVLPTSPTQDSSPSLEISALTRAFLSPEEDLSLTLTVRNPSTEPLDLTRVEIAGHRSTPSTRVRVLSFLDGSNTPLRTLWAQPSDLTVAPGASVEIPVNVPHSDLGWTHGINSWGPRGIEARVHTVHGKGSHILTARSLTVLAPNYELPGTPTGVFVPITSTTKDLARKSSVHDRTIYSPSPNETPAPTQENSHTSPTTDDSHGDSPSPSAGESSQESMHQDREKESGITERMAHTLRVLALPGVSVLIQPDVVADALTNSQTDTDSTPDTTKQNTAREDTSASRSALRLFSENPATEVIASAMYDADAAALAHAGKDSYLATSYTTGATALATAGVNATSMIAALAPGADRETVGALVGAGVKAVIVPGDEIPATGYQYAAPSARTSVIYHKGESEESLPALATDATISAALAGYLVGEGESVARATEVKELSPLNARQLTLALSAITYLERPADQRAMLLAVDRPELLHYGATDPTDTSLAHAISSTNLAETISALMSAPWVVPTTVSGLLNEQESPVQRADLPEKYISDGEALTEELTSATTTLSSITRIANLSVQPDVLVDPATEISASLAGLAWRSDPEARTRHIQDFSLLAQGYVNSIVVAPSSTINVISREASLPILVDNRLSVDIGVVVALTSKDQRLVSSQRVAVKIPAHGSTKARVPVEATGSGNITVEAQVLSPSGEKIGKPQVMHVRVRADWENTGTIILGGALCVVLMVGVFRSLSHGRRSTEAKLRGPGFSSGTPDEGKVSHPGDEDTDCDAVASCTCEGKATPSEERSSCEESAPEAAEEATTCNDIAEEYARGASSPSLPSSVWPGPTLDRQR